MSAGEAAPVALRRAVAIVVADLGCTGSDGKAAQLLEWPRQRQDDASGQGEGELGWSFAYRQLTDIRAARDRSSVPLDMAMRARRSALGGVQDVAGVLVETQLSG